MASVAKRLITSIGVTGAASMLMIAPSSPAHPASSTATALVPAAQQSIHAQPQSAQARSTANSSAACLTVLRPWGRYEGGKWRMYGTVRNACRGSHNGKWQMALQKKTKIAGITHWKGLAGRKLRSDQTGAFHVRATCKDMKKNTFRVVTSGSTVKVGPTLTVRC
ncbi:hypothetical protein [Nonomuraea sp. NPDC046570]|uniref:hypothetical protein n=1 Tax=Nonomuraea sp. NPDC046570 TaxID=3155255 RepID=UPI0033F9B33B